MSNVDLLKFSVASSLLDQGRYGGRHRQGGVGSAAEDDLLHNGRLSPEKPSRTGRPLDPILVVDDDPTCCRMMTSALEQEGYGVEATTDPTEALELVRARRYALVVSDVSMPGMRGTILAAEAVKLQPGLHTLLVTALADRRLRAEAEALGSLLLLKPVRLEVLFAAVREVVGGGAAKRAER
jgi:CheY-like chemotaxis protein